MCACVCFFFLNPFRLFLSKDFISLVPLSFIITDVMNFCALSCLYFISASRFVKTQNYLDFVDTYIHQVFLLVSFTRTNATLSPIVPSVRFFFSFYYLEQYRRKKLIFYIKCANVFVFLVICFLMFLSILIHFKLVWYFSSKF